MEEVKFKSDDYSYWKERHNIKSNTVRKVDKEDERFKALEKFESGENENLNIVIEHSGTGETFTREIFDVSFWEDLCIITW